MRTLTGSDRVVGTNRGSRSGATTTPGCVTSECGTLKGSGLGVTSDPYRVAIHAVRVPGVVVASLLDPRLLRCTPSGCSDGPRTWA